MKNVCIFVADKRGNTDVSQMKRLFAVCFFKCGNAAEEFFCILRRYCKSGFIKFYLTNVDNIISTVYKRSICIPEFSLSFTISEDSSDAIPKICNALFLIFYAPKIIRFFQSKLLISVNYYRKTPLFRYEIIF